MSNTEFIKKLLFRSSHRGTKEMDIVLGGFFSKNYENLSNTDLKEFEQLLDFSDKCLTDFFVMNKANDEINKISLVKKIKIHILNTE